MPRFYQIIMFSLIPMIAFAKADRIIFHGNHDFSSSELSSYFGELHESEFADTMLSYRLRNVQDSLIAHDYLFATLDSSRLEQTRKGRVRHIYLQEGSLARVASVQWLGDSSLVASVALRVMTRAGSTFHWSNLERDVNLLLTEFETSGYPFAKVEMNPLVSDSTTRTVDLVLKLQSGPLIKIDFVSFMGIHRARSRVLQLESRLQTGEKYDQRRMNAAHRRLLRLDYLKQVQPAEILIDASGKNGVRFRLEEARTTRVDIAAGYLPKSQNRSAVINGLVNLEFLNLFGSGRRARIHWEQPNNRIQTIALSYREPWIFSQPFAIRVDFAQRIEDTLYVNRQFTGRVEADLFDFLSVWGAVQQEAVYADSASAQATGLPNNQTLLLESGVAYDTRDHPTNPRHGVWFSMFGATGWRHRERSAIGIPGGEFRQKRIGIDSEAAKELFPFWIADIGIHIRALQSTEPEILFPDLFRLGGARTLRGYREEQFLGSRVGWTSAEMRYWLGPASRVFAFTDAGGVYRKERICSGWRQTTLWAAGAGIGLRLETNLGIWGIDYGLGEGDRLLNGKLHISLLSTF